MKVIDKSDATATLAEYASQIENGPVIVTSEGRPVAALVPLDNTDLESISLGTNPKFLDLIERSRARVKAEGGIPDDQMRAKFG
jgi:prevent-host-death family protein